MERIRQLRNEKGLSQAKLAVMAGMDPATLNRLEQGKGNPNLKTLERVAEALGLEVADLFPKGPSSSLEPSLFNGLEGGRPTTEPLSPTLRRHAASVRRAELDRVLKHLTLRLEALRDQAKTHYEAGTAPEELWPLFMDSVLLARGTKGLLIDSKEEAEELGGEIEEERRLRARLEHRAEDAEETREKIGDMWLELLNAKTEAEMEALRKELYAETESPGRDNVQELFRRDRAV